MSITRTRLADRRLPEYTRRDEIFNMVTHIVGGGLAVIGLAFLIARSLRSGDAFAVFASMIYGVSMITLYAMSSIYHGLTHEMAKKVMQVLDHCTIYFLIAGTYTPVCLCALRPVYAKIAWGVLAVVWGLAIVATVFTAIDLRRYRVFSMICYLGMGWCIIFFLRETAEVVTKEGFLFLLWGGIAYTLGAIMYGLGKKKTWMHGIFHLFVLVGSILQYICILCYVLPM